MPILREWIRRLHGTLCQGRRDAELEHELRSHIEMAEEDARRRGLDLADASRAARIEAGGVSQAMEALRDQRGLPWLDDLARDVSHGLRTLRRTPVFTAVALLTLALGIGANTAIFSIVNGVILRPLDYPRPEQLMYLTTAFPALGLTRNPLSVHEARVNDLVTAFKEGGDPAGPAALDAIISAARSLWSKSRWR
jgi:hypothetical protein